MSSPVPDIAVWRQAYHDDVPAIDRASIRRSIIRTHLYAESAGIIGIVPHESDLDNSHFSRALAELVHDGVLDFRFAESPALLALTPGGRTLAEALYEPHRHK